MKGLYPSVLLGGAGSDGLSSRAAITGLLREADLLAGLSHPNIIWLYGIVLPALVRSRCTFGCCIPRISRVPGWKKADVKLVVRTAPGPGGQAALPHPTILEGHIKDLTLHLIAVYIRPGSVSIWSL